MKKVFHNQPISENADLCQIKKVLIAGLKKIHQHASLRELEIQYVISKNILAAEFSYKGMHWNQSFMKQILGNSVVFNSTGLPMYWYWH